MKSKKELMIKINFLLFLLILTILSSNVLAAAENEEVPDTNSVTVEAITPVPSEAEAYSRIISKQSQYPEGMNWTNNNSYTSQSRSSSIYQGNGCAAFAYILSDAAFGNLPFTVHHDQNRIKVGDILRIDNDTHSVIVLEVRSSDYVIAEGNYNSSIHWGRTLNKSGLPINYIMTRYNGTVSSSKPQTTTPPNNTNGLVAIYRLYNPSTTEHLYTSSTFEVQELSNKFGWINENIGWYSSNTGTPVYRLYNPVISDHLYTTDLNEISVLTKTQGWVNDNSGKPLFYSNGFTNVYRLFNPLNARHFLTKDFSEYNYLSKNGWKAEGIKLLAVY